VVTFYGPWYREHLVELGAGGLRGRVGGPLGAVARLGAAAFMRQAQGRVLEAASAIVVLSAASRRDLAEFGVVASGARLVPGGIDAARFHPAAQTSLLAAATRPRCVAVRRLVPRMGLETLLAAFARIREEHPAATLAIAGDGPLRDDLARRTAQSPGVRLLGLVPEDELPGLYAAADLVLMPTRALEGFGLPVIEAWAAGTPVVGTPVGSLPELLRRADERFLARAATPEALAAAASWALGQDKARWSEQLVGLSRRYRWAEVAAEMAAVYAAAAR
jgi:glycosyltransferase involved in cell wall biosynthesis